MNLLDLIILVLFALGLVIGFKRGIIRQALSTFGTIVSTVCAFLFKTPIAKFLCMKCPFFSFSGALKGLSVINLFVYEVIAFLVILAILMSLLQLLIFVSKVLEKIVSLTIIFALPSKIGGEILGLLENYIVVFIILYIISLPIFDISIIRESTLRDRIVNDTPILNNMAKKSIEVGKELANLMDEYSIKQNSDEYNLKALDIFLKYNITSVETVDALSESGKLQVKNIESVLTNYRD